jgi:penicillin amidase
MPVHTQRSFNHINQKLLRFTLFILIVTFLISCNKSGFDNLTLSGLKEPVEIIRDEWGVNHIYAKNQHDLFFAQGYAAAKDRLFQFEIWRRQATGTVAEILGQREIKRDIGSRLFKFRGDMKQEMNHYHNDGEEIITAYSDGVNAFIDEILKTPEKLPIEFKLLNIKPGKWTPEVVISRHQGLLGNIGVELKTGRAVARLGSEKVKELSSFHPQVPDIDLDPAINKELLFDDILELYDAFRATVKFEPEDVQAEYRVNKKQKISLNMLPADESLDDKLSIGSNNWVVGANKMAEGAAFMANDPHRTVSVPSLRYMSHLVAPGWNVIGGGEPEIPGISIGHNEYGAWGLTIFGTDSEDLYVYALNPNNLRQYQYQGKWENMKVIKEIIKVKGKSDVIVDLLYTRHGPISYVDSQNKKAYAIRCGWLEPGAAPYLASLRMDQAKTWEEFREACSYSHIPSLNMVWADKKGNIGWQVVGYQPIRKKFSGLVPVPGDGRFEWEGRLPIKERPNTYNPAKGFFATANQNLTPKNFNRWDATGFAWADPFRGNRINEVLGTDKKLTMDDMKALQVDYLSIPARTITPLLNKLTFSDRNANEAIAMLKNWDYKLRPNSIEAAIYVAWENQIKAQAAARFIPTSVKDLISLQTSKIIDWIMNPDKKFGNDPIVGRNIFLHETFMAGLGDLHKKIGSDMSKWQYGQEKYKHTYMAHALGYLVKDSIKASLNLGPLPRGGYGDTPGSTGGNLLQNAGASFRIIVNTGDWDATVATNGPGQSGDPTSPFYRNLFEPWAKDQHFPIYYSRDKIEKVNVSKTLLKPE